MIVMRPTAAEAEVQAVIDRIEAVGARAHPSRGDEVTVIGAIGDREHVAPPATRGRAGRRPGRPRILKPFKRPPTRSEPGEPKRRSRWTEQAYQQRALLADRRAVPVESRDQMLTTAHAVPAAGATMLRGGAYKPRTSPYTFQGLGRTAWAAAEAEARPACRSSPSDRRRDLEAVLDVADLIQIGARNMQNYPCSPSRPLRLPGDAQARAVGTIEELLMRRSTSSRRATRRDAVRARHPHLRDRLPLHARPDGRARCSSSARHLPVIVDPSHAAGGATWCAAVAGRGRRRRRRAHRRGAPEPGRGDQRRAGAALRGAASPSTRPRLSRRKALSAA